MTAEDRVDAAAVRIVSQMVTGLAGSAQTVRIDIPNLVTIAYAFADALEHQRRARPKEKGA